MNLKTFLNQITALIQNLSLRQKIVSIASVVVVVGFLAFLVFFKSPNSGSISGYGVLFDNTTPSDSALIIQQLEKDNIPYKVINEGTIAVPSNVVYKERIAISALGLPKNSKVGFEIFDKAEFGSTDFEQRIKYLRALEGELSRTINALNPINDSSVHIAIPKESVFSEHKQPASASIVVDIKPGLKLSNKQISGIKNLVSSSVSNLKPDHVKIVDQNGLPLGEEEGEYSSDRVKNQIRYKNEYEARLEKKIIDMLTPIAGGSNKVVAKVTIDFDFKQENSISEVYDPNSVPRSEQSVEEKKSGSTPQSAGGVPGAVSNIGPVQGLSSQKNTQTYQKSTSTTNYEISKKTIKTQNEFATIDKISAAVVVDGDYRYIADPKDPNKKDLKYIPLTKAQMAAVDAIVKQTIGYDKKRGDEVTVSNLEFKPLSKDEAKAPTETFLEELRYYIMPIFPLLKYALVILVLLIFYKKVIVPFSKKMLEEQVEEIDELRDEVLDEEENAEDTLEQFRKARQKVEEQLGLSSDFNEEALKYDVLLEKLKTLSDQKTEEVSRLLQNLIKNASEFDVSGKGKDI
ncbi:flagellar basal-body MS-ring/collar protein FliF [Sulfurospirillum sp. 1612]|uniref:flagellar basal-body MS-ring/collar protein FliF n=1 Tax=Sulfurospirillum sp. 1612 TaxID=3094835 RepID=UPI002F91C9F4